MSIGPCLCGDPYCNSCFPGNDGGAFEELIIALEEELSKFNKEECIIFVECGRAAVAAHQQAMKSYADERRRVEMEDQL